GSSASLLAGCAGGCASRGGLVPTILPESSMDPFSAQILDLAALIWGPWTIVCINIDRVPNVGVTGRFERIAAIA
ncbi:MAG: hypothetical protein IJM67_01255, partial [Atopobiaceae bacterium]|nr:hypothetical protein [Atopobiaceae bacterium]